MRKCAGVASQIWASFQKDAIARELRPNKLDDKRGRTNMKGRHAAELMLLVLAISMAGCGTNRNQIDVSQFTPTTLSPSAEDALAFPRKCDANRASSDPSWWLRVKCVGEPSLPPECEKPGSYDLPPCKRWVFSRAIQQQQLENITDAWTYGTGTFYNPASPLHF
jgi:hypothetical protein